MRAPMLSLVALALAAPLLAQNTAPAAQDSPSDPKTYVSPAQKAKASDESSKAAAAQKPAAGAPEATKVVLDSVIAIINGDVLLQSDVEQERRFEALQLLPANENNDVRAAEHLITRTLILQQMKEQNQSSPDVTAEDVDKSIEELKKQLPGCLPTRCQSAAGWQSYLSEKGLTPEEVQERWRERLVVVSYLNLRFRTGARVPMDQVQAYYDKNLVPQFAAKHEKPPTVKALRPRIEEILLQEQVSKQIDDWEATLRQEGSVQILVPAYGQSNTRAEDEDDIPGGGQ